MTRREWIKSVIAGAPLLQPGTGQPGPGYWVVTEAPHTLRWSAINEMVGSFHPAFGRVVASLPTQDYDRRRRVTVEVVVTPRAIALRFEPIP
jgi:hypothetical protein